jgi:hypothetical protein
MNQVCLHAKVTIEHVKLKVSISELCSTASKYLPLLVDEGFLLVDFNGGVSKLYVKRK